jgi:hypothetical protein
MPVGTRPRLLVGDASSPTAVQCLARIEARYGESGSCDLRYHHAYMPGSLIMEGFYCVCNITCTPTPKSPTRLVRYFFLSLNIPKILSCLWAGLVSQEFFGGEEGTGGSEIAADIREAALGQSAR